ncbi:MAG: metal ABC transporter permease, partial [Promethearchaeia archaeon]
AALAISLATKAVGAILVYAIVVAPAAASNEVFNSVRAVMIAVFAIALISQLIGITASFTFRTSPSAIAGILAALSYLVAVQIKKIRDRARIEKQIDRKQGQVVGRSPK